MSSTISTCRSVRSRSRSLMIRTTPLERVADPYDDTAMKSNSTGRSIAREQVAHEHERALEHTDEERRPARVVGRDLLAEPDDALPELDLGHDHPRPDGSRHGRPRWGTCLALETQPSGGPAHRAAAAQLRGRGARRAATGEDACRPRRATAAEVRASARTARRASTGGQRGERRGPTARRLRSASNASRQLVEQVRLRRAGPSACRVSTGTRSRPRRLRAARAAPRGATQLRRCTGSSFDGSCDRREARGASQSARTSARRTPSSGRTTWPRRAGIPASPLAAAPAEQVEQHGLGLVVGGVRDEHRGRARARRRAASSAAYRASRARASRFPPGAIVDPHASHAHAEPARPRRATTSASRALSGRRPWSTCTAIGVEPGVGGDDEQRERVGAAGAGDDDRRDEAVEVDASRPGDVHDRVGRATAAATVRRRRGRASVVGCCELVERRQQLRAPPRGVDRVDPGLALDLVDERLAELVLPHLQLEPESRCSNAVRAPGVCAGPAAPRAMRACPSTSSTPSRFMTALPWPSSSDMSACTVASVSRCSADANRRHERHPRRSGCDPGASRRPRGRALHEHGAGRARRRRQLARPARGSTGCNHGTPVNCARWVQLVQRDPEAEVAGPEREPLLERRGCCGPT